MTLPEKLPCAGLTLNKLQVEVLSHSNCLAEEIIEPNLTAPP